MCITIVVVDLVIHDDCDLMFQKYLDEAENDKQRYIDELKQFQKSDVYQTLVKKKQLKGKTDGDRLFCLDSS